jgi:hypothetical protein
MALARLRTPRARGVKFREWAAMPWARWRARHQRWPAWREPGARARVADAFRASDWLLVAWRAWGAARGLRRGPVGGELFHGGTDGRRIHPRSRPRVRSTKQCDQFSSMGCHAHAVAVRSAATDSASGRMALRGSGVRPDVGVAVCRVACRGTRPAHCSLPYPRSADNPRRSPSDFRELLPEPRAPKLRSASSSRGPAQKITPPWTCSRPRTRRPACPAAHSP